MDCAEKDEDDSTAKTMLVHSVHSVQIMYNGEVRFAHLEVSSL
jgi:hypothetical protein